MCEGRTFSIHDGRAVAGRKAADRPALRVDMNDRPRARLQIHGRLVSDPKLLIAGRVDLEGDVRRDEGSSAPRWPAASRLSYEIYATSGTSGRVYSPGGVSLNFHSVPTSPRPRAHKRRYAPSSNCRRACRRLGLTLRTGRPRIHSVAGFVSGTKTSVSILGHLSVAGDQIHAGPSRRGMRLTTLALRCILVGLWSWPRTRLYASRRGTSDERQATWS